MLDIKQIRNNIALVRSGLSAKNVDPSVLADIVAKDTHWREQSERFNELRARQNKASKDIGRIKKEGGDATAILAEMQNLSKAIKASEQQTKSLEDEIDQLLAGLPNLPHATTPIGKGESDNVVVRTVGDKKDFHFSPKDHLTLAEQHQLLDFNRGGKISGSGFPVFKGAGARLERAMLNFFLDTHIEKNGFVEVFPPFLVNKQSMFGTAQLPKMAEDMYYINEDDLYLIPTAEVPITNLHANEILSVAQLPIKYAAYSACFRREAGSYGKDTRGFLRVHQFNKIEMVQFVEPDSSYDVLEEMVGYATSLLEDLEIPYRVLELCSADLSFAAAKCFDLEVWAPGENNWLEASSVSNFEDFQARRASIRYRPGKGEKPRFVHTLNGSGLATSRVLVALLENYQNEDGSIDIPKVLQPYMGGLERISADD
jgi:seryl-tRNA synthetase